MRAQGLLARALILADDYPATAQLLTAAKSAGADASFLVQIAQKMAQLAATSLEHLAVADSAAEAGDAGLKLTAIDHAEEGVASVEDLRQVQAAVAKHLSGDAPRAARVAQKLAKREANQARYGDFQKQEAALQTPLEHVKLADRVMAELEDPFYAAKLLGAAEWLLGGQGFHFHDYRPLVLAIDRHLHDEAWLGKALDYCAEHAGDAFWLREIAHCAVAEITARALGLAKARQYYQTLETQLSTAQAVSAYELVKLSQAVARDLGDNDWAARLLEQAAGAARDHYVLAHVGSLYQQQDNLERAAALYSQAAQACTSYECCRQLVDRLKSYRLGTTQLRDIYRRCGATLAESAGRLQWAEGIMELFDDRTWAAEAYAAIEALFPAGAEARRLQASCQRQYGFAFFL